ncbi:hypothetical protein M2189_008720 [Bradyrhizobium japonicum]|nr:hypothetical protein [Bradyrhizobium japonicum]MCS3965517.1 hypothetical protein [Bradyrhizobium japonicum]MCS3997824.1 hypothetical protein [Bradyrhizobium japonicum]
MGSDFQPTGCYFVRNGNELVAHSLPFDERWQSGFFDGGHMNKYVLASAVGPYEAVTLKLVEPDHESVSQISSGIRMQSKAQNSSDLEIFLFNPGRFALVRGWTEFRSAKQAGAAQRRA